MLDDKVIFILAILFYLGACSGKEHKSTDGPPYGSLTQTDSTSLPSLDKGLNDTFVPDSSVCNIALESYYSIERELGNVMDVESIKGGFETYYVSNPDTSEFMKLIFCPGDTKNAFCKFVVSKITQPPIERRLNFTTCNVLSTESNVRLGITISELEKIKGLEHIKTSKNGLDIYSYAIVNNDKSDFLRKYNMPIYIADYYFENNRLVEFEFGFDYP